MSGGFLQPRAGVLELDHLLHDLVYVDGRTPTQEMADLGDIGHAPRHVLEAFLVGLVVGYVNDLRRARQMEVFECLAQLSDLVFPCSRCPNYLGVSPRFASSRTDFVVADLSIVDLVDRPHAAGGFVICLANTR